MDRKQWQVVKQAPLREMDHAGLERAKTIQDLRTIDVVDQLVRSVAALPAFTLFFALFRSVPDAVRAARALSFSCCAEGDVIGSPIVITELADSGASARGSGVNLPAGFSGRILAVPGRATIFILGGSLDEQQRNEVFTAFERQGKVSHVALPAGAPPLRKNARRWLWR